ncbi:uncharacterized protein [Rutidosis leptorrhynchoides]|uniref:uncharacterized protein n=1 Tax=Rutidosis leptorrhynchoides TaxID=125765 RepID=UPI003A99191A
MSIGPWDRVGSDRNCQGIGSSELHSQMVNSGLNGPSTATIGCMHGSLDAFNHSRPFRDSRSNGNNFLLHDMKKLTSKEANDLEAVFSEFEIWEAVKIVGARRLRDLIEAINTFWEKGEISKGCNASFLTLIPKTLETVCLNDYRPISLIGSFYKVIAKLLANRLKGVIPNLVGYEQSAFIKGRNILDGALVADESLSFLKSKRLKSVVFKVDFEKAFNCLNWDFLLEVMEIMGFRDKWRKWIITVGFYLHPSLNVLTKQAVQNQRFSRVEIGRDKIPILHLQYANETIFFGSWSEGNIRNLMKLLKCFELTLGLKVNFQKGNLIGIEVEKSEVERMARLFSCKVGTIPFINLGLLVGDNLKKKESWTPVINKFEKRLSDWKARSILFGGRLTLVNSVLNSLPLLSRLETNLEASVQDRLSWDEVKCVGQWSWLRAPSGRAKDELQLMMDVISDTKFNPQARDTWKWKAGGSEIFSTKLLTTLINSRVLLPISSSSETLCNKLVPNKIDIFVWRARRKHLPVLFELDKRGIDLHSVRCPLCDDDIETVNHSLILCKHVLEVWCKVLDWWGRGGIPFVNVEDLFLDSGQTSSYIGKSIRQTVIWSASYLI